MAKFLLFAAVISSNLTLLLFPLFLHRAISGKPLKKGCGMP